METSVKTAIYAILDAALSVTVYNGAPLNAALPYVDIDEYFDDDNSTKTYIGETADVRVHIWSKDKDQCATIRQQIKTALNRVELTVAGYNFVDCQYKSGQAITDVDGITRHAWADFEIIAHS